MLDGSWCKWTEVDVDQQKFVTIGEDTTGDLNLVLIVGCSGNGQKSMSICKIGVDDRKLMVKNGR